MSKKTKSCARCKKRKPLDEFPKSAYAKDGHLKNCSPCHGKICKAGKKKKAAQKASGIHQSTIKEEKAKVDAANTALQLANGTRSKRSPFKAIVKELYAKFAKEGFEVEHVEFVGDTARVRYSRTEEIKL